MTTPSSASVPAGHAPAPRGWLDEALRRIGADVDRSADTHPPRLPIPGAAGATPHPTVGSAAPVAGMIRTGVRSNDGRSNDGRTLPDRPERQETP